MLLLENAEVVLFSSSITLYKVYPSSDSDLWHILDAKDLRVTAALAVALVCEQEEGTERWGNLRASRALRVCLVASGPRRGDRSSSGGSSTRGSTQPVLSRPCNALGNLLPLYVLLIK